MKTNIQIIDDLLRKSELSLFRAKQRNNVSQTEIDNLMDKVRCFKYCKELISKNVETNLYDAEEIHFPCTVHILKNSASGEISIGWWEGKPEERGIKYVED